MAVYILSNDKSLRKEIRSTFALPSVTFMNKIQVYFLIQEEMESKGKRCDLQVFFWKSTLNYLLAELQSEAAKFRDVIMVKPDSISESVTLLQAQIFHQLYCQSTPWLMLTNGDVLVNTFAMKR